jgi:hypothetical protein
MGDYDEGDPPLFQHITPTGDNNADADEHPDLADVHFNEPQAHESEAHVTTEDDVFKSHSPPLRDALELDVSELYNDMKVDAPEDPSKRPGMLSVHYNTRSFLKDMPIIDISAVEADRSHELLDNVASSRVELSPPREMHTQEITYLDTFKLGSHPAVKEPLEVAGNEIQGQVADVLENVAHLGNFAVRCSSLF